MAIYGYIRVSSLDQNEDRQLIAMKDAGVPQEHLYIDKQSGKDFERPAYKRLIKRLRKNDVLFVVSLDRLGRNYAEMLEQWRIITKKKRADIVVMDLPLLDTRLHKDLVGTLIRDIVLQLFSYVAQQEREHIHIRQAQGIAAAKARGVKFGRPVKTMPPEFVDSVKRWRKGEIKMEEILKTYQISPATFYRRMSELELLKKL